MNEWDFFFDKGEKPSKNIERLLQTLAFNTLQFRTKDNLKGKGKHNSIYNIYDVTMRGNVPYAKFCLNESISELKDFFQSYVDSEESLEQRIYELSFSRILIKDYFLNNNLHDPVLLDMNFIVKLHGKKPGEILDVRFDQCIISDNAAKEINEHERLRHAYINLFDSYLAVWLDKVQLSPLLDKIRKGKRDSEKEIGLLEVWIGLKEEGYLSHLKTKTDHAEHRRLFFELFSLADRNFNDRNRDIKKRKRPVARLLPRMVTHLENYHKKKDDVSTH